MVCGWDTSGIKEHSVIWLIDGSMERQLEVSQVHVNSLTPIRPELGQHPITRLPHVHVNPAIDFVLTGEEVGWQ